MEENLMFDSKARSPWTSLQGIERITVSPGKHRIEDSITIPGSKSLTNRALIMSALADGKSQISGILKSDDSYWCIEALKKLGVNIKLQGNTAYVNGNRGWWNSADLYIGSAGTIARFLPGVLAACHEGEWELEASQSMRKRPVAPLIDALKELGAEIDYLAAKDYYPLRIKGTEMKGGEVSLSGAISSQFISGILIAAPCFNETTTVTIKDEIVQHAYVYLTLDLMKEYGADVQDDHALQQIVINPQGYKAKDIQLEPDASAACYFLALAAVTNGRIRINGLTEKTKQPDIQMLEVFEQMGCRVTKGADFIELEGTMKLKGDFEISMKEMSDQALTLAAIAPFADGPITIKGVAHIRHHESDRISVICKALTQLGIITEEFNDGLKVYPGKPKPALLNTYDDHRVAMALALIGARAEGIELNDPGCVSKTFPPYFALLEDLGVRITKHQA
ncbi:MULTISPECIES: 3-phosphoshikimate 1-carboxyvinyltransferase [Oceanobacillus]|uniref:3-phosphoshikimate 1-carboxyvinyltransferase n=1 Tax=Oceanobacillus aidingensis TaxID=645964 RepID=A0ABV9JZ13_9BACI|nr:3-phosphoshikimate 1-carboxyvinyltransferase [Oceanobacillus oncorhynchi]MDM8099879.1 3-phosphoshikimate 1-carboxyvinyltransferase [Oceanobacillus oncorhynchi]UUI40417.1 3-phosphoshikimate 1-carboxyvinyltransferase [Oceanobacillus oncorhynchi]